MSEVVTMNNEFRVVRVSKAGKETYRGVLGVITSGNTKERSALANVVIAGMIANNNFRGLAREVIRVFPATLLKKAGGFTWDAKAKTLYSVEQSAPGQITLTEINANTINKATLHAMARGIIAALDGKELKGEKAMFHGALVSMLAAEQKRLEAIEAPTQEVATAE